MTVAYWIVKKTRIMDVMINSSVSLVPLFLGAYQLIDFGFIILLIFLCFINAFTFLLNDYYDRDVDSQDEKRKNFNFFSSTNPRDHFLGKLLLVTSFILTVLLPLFFFQQFLPITVIGLFLSISYSHPKIHVKNRLVFDWLIHSLWPILLVSVSYLYFFEDLNSSYWFLIVVGALVGFYAQINNQLRDFHIDKENNLVNTSIWLGYEKAVIARRINAFLIFLLAFIAICFTNAFLTLLVFCLSLIIILKKGNLDRLNYHNILWACVYLLEKIVIKII
ncbi:MAG: UbiA family prenyltransferase [Candidatus Odinarchaeota archaeon]